MKYSSLSLSINRDIHKDIDDFESIEILITLFRKQVPVNIEMYLQDNGYTIKSHILNEIKTYHCGCRYLTDVSINPKDPHSFFVENNCEGLKHYYCKVWLA